MRDPQAQYEVDDFGNDEAAYCPLIYTVAIPAPASAWMTALVSGKGSSWQTDTNTNVAAYIVTITATGIEGVTLDATFTLNVNPDCSIQILTPSVTVNHTYRVYDAKLSYEVQEFANDESTHCPLTYSHIYDTI